MGKQWPEAAKTLSFQILLLNFSFLRIVVQDLVAVMVGSFCPPPLPFALSCQGLKQGKLIFRNVFTTLSNIYNGVFCEKAPPQTFDKAINTCIIIFIF